MRHTYNVTPAEIAEFTEYCCTFYEIGNPEAIYPFATRAEIGTAVAARLRHCCACCFPFDGDSVDRELVRDEIEDARIEAANTAARIEMAAL